MWDAASAEGEGDRMMAAVHLGVRDLVAALHRHRNRRLDLHAGPVPGHLFRRRHLGRDGRQRDHFAVPRQSNHRVRAGECAGLAVRDPAAGLVLADVAAGTAAEARPVYRVRI